MFPVGVAHAGHLPGAGLMVRSLAEIPTTLWGLGTAA
jgi:hypothetical protein